MVFVESGEKFQFGALGVVTIIQTTKTREWELVDFIFNPGDKNITGFYFNNYGRKGDVGYIDNWEIYEWPNESSLKKIIELCDAEFNSNIQGYDELKNNIAKAKVLLDNMNPEIVAEVDDIIMLLKDQFYVYASDNASVENPINLTSIIANPDMADNSAWISTCDAKNKQVKEIDGYTQYEH